MFERIFDFEAKKLMMLMIMIDLGTVERENTGVMQRWNEYERTIHREREKNVNGKD